ncbi:unnamed protein product [marine sediment metagenome]|uniref:Uncharacterized protein n=1 Tax=marine sediment metagenome TaxID=412755 RepID=X1AV24_9ZZZZ
MSANLSGFSIFFMDNIISEGNLLFNFKYCSNLLITNLINALEEAINLKSFIFIATQRDPEVEKPKLEDIYSIVIITFNSFVVVVYSN